MGGFALHRPVMDVQAEAFLSTREQKCSVPSGVLSARQQEASLLSVGCQSCRVSMLAGSEWQGPAGRCWALHMLGLSAAM